MEPYIVGVLSVLLFIALCGVVYEVFIRDKARPRTWTDDELRQWAATHNVRVSATNNGPSYLRYRAVYLPPREPWHLGVYRYGATPRIALTKLRRDLDAEFEANQWLTENWEQ